MMKNIFDELYDQYSRPTVQLETQREIDESHRALIEQLAKPERKLVLRIIDNKDLIAGANARESFQCGFWLAWRLFTQLGSYDSGRSLEEILNAGGRFVVPQGSGGDAAYEKSTDDSCFKNLE
ncbi:MAG: hypothetical protein RSD08_03410 [Oscillospiraceae bacterium]